MFPVNVGAGAGGLGKGAGSWKAEYISTECTWERRNGGCLPWPLSGGMDVLRRFVVLIGLKS